MLDGIIGLLAALLLNVRCAFFFYVILIADRICAAAFLAVWLFSLGYGTGRGDARPPGTSLILVAVYICHISLL